MYDNHVAVLRMFPSLIAMRPTPANLLCQIHGRLTQGVDVFEDQGTSGVYRNRNVNLDLGISRKIKCPPFAIAQQIVEDYLIPKIEEKRDGLRPNQDAYDFAWWCHHVFECAHPFTDANGKVGRLLLNLVLEMSGQEKITVWARDKLLYYWNLAEFQRDEFPKILRSLNHVPWAEYYAGLKVHEAYYTETICDDGWLDTPGALVLPSTWERVNETLSSPPAAEHHTQVRSYQDERF